MFRMKTEEGNLKKNYLQLIKTHYYLNLKLGVKLNFLIKTLFY